MRSNEEFARYIDATLLKPNVTQEDMRQHLEAARRFHFKTVAIGCAWIPYAKELLAESDVGIDAPIGFPNGYSTTESKVFETIDAFAKGATEADILINIGWLRSGRYAELEDELKRFVAAAGGKVTKKMKPIRTMIFERADRTAMGHSVRYTYHASVTGA